MLEMGLALGKKSQFPGFGDRFTATVDVKLLVDLDGVEFDRPRRNIQGLRDFPIAQVLGQKSQDLNFTGRQGINQRVDRR